jgi:hypothetical protein
MNPEMPKIWKAAALVSRDLLHVLRSLTVLISIALVIILALGLVPFLIPVAGWSRLSVNFLFAGWTAVHALLLTPYMIAVHRFIILKDAKASYRLAPEDKQFRRYFGWSLMFFAMIWMAGFLYNRLISLETSVSSVLLTITGLAAIAVLVAIALHVAILFPAIAVDAPGATLNRAIADTKGYAVRAFFIFLLAFLTLAVAGAATTGLVVFVIGGVMRGASATWTLAVTLAILFSIIRTIGVTLAVIIASRLYEWFGTRVKRTAVD